MTTTYAAGSNLLSGIFSDGSIVGTIGGTSGGTFASGPNGGGTINGTSAATARWRHSARLPAGNSRRIRHR